MATLSFWQCWASMLELSKEHPEVDPVEWYFFVSEIVDVGDAFTKISFECKEFRKWRLEPKSETTDPQVSALLRVINSKRDPKPTKWKHKQRTSFRQRTPTQASTNQHQLAEVAEDSPVDDIMDAGGGGPPPIDEVHDVCKPVAIYLDGKDGKPLGSISYFPGANGNMSYAIACKRHRCSKFVSGWRVSDPDKLEEWLRLAEHPNCNSKTKHLEMFEACVGLKPLPSKGSKPGRKKTEPASSSSKS